MLSPASSASSRSLFVPDAQQERLLEWRPPKLQPSVPFVLDSPPAPKVFQSSGGSSTLQLPHHHHHHQAAMYSQSSSLPQQQSSLSNGVISPPTLSILQYPHVNESPYVPLPVQSSMNLQNQLKFTDQSQCQENEDINSSQSLKCANSKSHPNLATIAEDVDSPLPGVLRTDPVSTTGGNINYQFHNAKLHNNLPDPPNKHAFLNPKHAQMCSSLPNLLSETDQSCRNILPINMPRLDRTARFVSDVGGTTSQYAQSHNCQLEFGSQSSDDDEVTRVTKNCNERIAEISASQLSDTHLSPSLYYGEILDVGICHRKEEDTRNNPNLPRYTYTPIEFTNSSSCLSSMGRTLVVSNKAWKSLSDIALLAQQQLVTTLSDQTTIDGSRQVIDESESRLSFATPAILDRNKPNSKGIKPPPLYTRTSYPLLPFRKQFSLNCQDQNKHNQSREAASCFNYQENYGSIQVSDNCGQTTQLQLERNCLQTVSLTRSSPNLCYSALHQGAHDSSASDYQETQFTGNEAASCPPPPLPPKPARFIGQALQNQLGLPYNELAASTTEVNTIADNRFDYPGKDSSLGN